MNAKIEISKSFDDGKEFSKQWDIGDFEQFFTEEGQYLDRLAGTAEVKGVAGDKFTVTYTVTVEV